MPRISQQRLDALKSDRNYYRDTYAEILEQYSKQLGRTLSTQKRLEKAVNNYEALRDENLTQATRLAKLERFIDDVATIDKTFAERFTTLGEPRFTDAHHAAERQRELNRQAADDRLLALLAPATAAAATRTKKETK